jgi:hypothetical protein
MAQRNFTSAKGTRLRMTLAGLFWSVAMASTAAAQAPGAATSNPHLDPERVAIARKIYDVIGEANIEALTKAFLTNLRPAMKKAINATDEARQQAISDAVSDSIAFIIPKAVDASVDAMAEEFTAAQLKDTLAFYSSSTGQIMVRKMPAVMQQASATMVAEMPELVHQMQLRYCAKVTCTTSEQQAFAAISAQMKAHAPG